MRVWTQVLGVVLACVSFGASSVIAFGRECSQLISDVCASWKGVASHHACLHKHHRCCRVHAKVRTGGERVWMWIGLGWGEFRANRAACRHD